MAGIDPCHDRFDTGGRHDVQFGRIDRCLSAWGLERCVRDIRAVGQHLTVTQSNFVKRSWEPTCARACWWPGTIVDKSPTESRLQMPDEGREFWNVG